MVLADDASTFINIAHINAVERLIGNYKPNIVSMNEVATGSNLQIDLGAGVDRFVSGIIADDRNGLTFELYYNNTSGTDIELKTGTISYQLFNVEFLLYERIRQGYHAQFLLNLRTKQHSIISEIPL